MACRVSTKQIKGIKGKVRTSDDQITTLISLFEFLQLLHCMSTGQLYVVWSNLCHLVKFYMSTGQLYVVWSSF